ncbi:energy transducer TonB [Pantoea graminicola]|uniref:TonB family protein n=1 Tax=Pantoea sp. ARC607 TaxID=2027922 RepID=UPI000DA7CD3B|nr:TonB family protein [Pantoea sp. ARC607]PZL94282.1 energy transducer TonB [Pantoea sp. ARC607]
MKFTLTALLLTLSVCVQAENNIKYPERAQKLRFGGEVELVYDVSPEGIVDNVRILKVQPNYLFDREVKRQISAWKFPQNEPKKDVALKIIFKPN